MSTPVVPSFQPRRSLQDQFQLDDSFIDELESMVGQLNAQLDELYTQVALGSSVTGQPVSVQRAAILIGTRAILNFIEGFGLSMTIVDDVVNERIDITLAVTGVVAHNLLGASHSDTVAAAPAKGSVIVGDSSLDWVKFPLAGADGDLFTKFNADLTHGVAWRPPVVQQSALLDGGTVHTDTAAGAPVDGDTIIGNATPAWSRLAAGTEGDVFTMGAARPEWAAPADATAFDYQAGNVNVANVPAAWTTVADWWLLQNSDMAWTPQSVVLLVFAGGVSATFSVRVQNVTRTQTIASGAVGITGALARYRGATLGTWPALSSLDDIEIQVFRTAGAAGNTFIFGGLTLLAKSL